MILGIDPVGGASGNMFLGAFADFGIDLDNILNFLSKNLNGELQWEIATKEKFKLFGKNVKIIDNGEFVKRDWKDIRILIDSLKISKTAKETAKEIFYQIALAESKIHNKPVDIIHFHEVGGIDAIADIVGSVLCYEELGFPKTFLLRALPLGSGIGTSMHGKIPYPAPATAEILKDLPVKFLNIDSETVTPTGAAIIKVIAKEYFPEINFKINKISYGIGDSDFPTLPNILRLFSLGNSGHSQYIYEIKANIDDMTPAEISHLLKNIMELGALDVIVFPGGMKKGRTGFQIEVLSTIEKKSPVINYLLKNSTTGGVRFNLIERNILDRKTVSINTKFGKVRYKIYKFKDKMKVQPEYDDMEKILMNNDITFKELTNFLINEYNKETDE